MAGQWLLEERKLKGWNQWEAPLWLAVSQTYLSLLEKGKGIDKDPIVSAHSRP